MGFKQFQKRAAGLELFQSGCSFFKIFHWWKHTLKSVLAEIEILWL